MIISIDRVPRPVSPVIIFLPFLEDRLWRARLDTIRCVPSIPDQYLCFVILADDEAQKKNAKSERRQMQFSVEESAAIWAGSINWCPSAPARYYLNQSVLSIACPRGREGKLSQGKPVTVPCQLKLSLKKKNFD